MSTPTPGADTLISAIRLHLIPENPTADSHLSMTFTAGRYIGLRLAHTDSGDPVARVRVEVWPTEDGRHSLNFDLDRAEQNLVEVLVEGESANAGDTFVGVNMRAINSDCIIRIFSPGFAGDQRLLKSGQTRTYSFPLSTVTVTPP